MKNRPQTLVLLFTFTLLIAFYGCGKPSDDPSIPPVVISSGCPITSDVDQALGARNFEYDDKGYLIKMTAPNFYYGPFVETISANKVVDSYPTASVDGNGNHTYGTIVATYSNTGGSGNLYDGNPEYVNELFAGSTSGAVISTAPLFQFLYDDAKKHLTTILIPVNGGTPGADGFTFFRIELNFTYDANDNVTQVKIIHDFSETVKTPQNGTGEVYYKQTSDELLTITYDDKPSPYAAISKYWKFVGGDVLGFGAYNIDKVRFWVARCAYLSKNNPVKMTGKLITGSNSVVADVNASLTYQYNDKNLPVSMALNGSGIQAFTYNCK